jgi:signal transduction histidine kinase
VALKRGMRLDESTPGSGLGLSIVKDIVNEYGGELALDTSALGGLRATVRLPAR